jgi:hypothetical protein
MDFERLLLEFRSMDLDSSLAVGEHVPAADAQTVSYGTHEPIEGPLAQGEDHSPDTAPKDGRAAHRARLGARIQAAASQELEGILVRRPAHEVCHRMPRAILLGDHRVFGLDQYVTVWACQQGAEGLITSLARPARDGDGGSEMVEIQTVQLADI